MRTVDLIVKKREGKVLSPSEIEYLIFNYTRGKIPDYQMAAFLMAVFFRGLNKEETVALTRAMLETGPRWSYSNISGFKIDKHSTGGVGDKISLILAPLIAACGLYVPMLCGRGLGHTGGTVDKLEGIPGYRTQLSKRQAQALLASCGFCFMSQTAAVAPADRLLYALRDVTGTVESIPLITASILSKKLSEGADGLVFDVKVGQGAFMKDLTCARQLAESLIQTAQELGTKASALITQMDEPLGYMIGNLLEVKEALNFLMGEMPEDLKEVTLALAKEMLRLAGLFQEGSEAEDFCLKQLASGKALELFLKNITLQGGKSSFIKDPARIPQARYRQAVLAERDGIVQDLDAYKLGLASMLLGAGRKTKKDRIDPYAGLELLKKRGERVAASDEICILYTSDESLFNEAKALVKEAIGIGEQQSSPNLLVIESVRML